MRSAEPAVRSRNRRRISPVLFSSCLLFLLFVAPDSSRAGYTILHAHLADGVNAYPGLTADGAGYLYGATFYGGLFNCGTLYRVHADGSGYERLRSFGCQEFGANPYSAPILDGAGALFGTTANGGTAGKGTVYRMDVDGTDFQVLHSFAGAADGQTPFAQLTLSGTTLYGSTLDGGSAGLGVLFAIGTDGSGFDVIRHFVAGAADGAHPYGKLVLLGDTLYGTAFHGGAANDGMVFRVKTDHSGFTIVHDFSGADGAHPDGGLVLVSGAFNEVYGTTWDGGANGQGTLFRVRTNAAAFAVLHHFAGTAGSDGSNPIGALARDGSGNFYGGTYLGGASGNGIAFRWSPSGPSYQVLHDFAGGTAEGRWLHGGVVVDASGSLYGTTVYGGSQDVGTIFALSTAGGTPTLLHAFAVDGEAPVGPPTRGEAGRIYGTLSYGGANGRGALYGMNDDGSGYTLIRSFAGGTLDGAFPEGGVTFAPPNLLYGVTQIGGAADRGLVYRIQTDGGAFQILHAFAGGTGDGMQPFARPTLDGAGLLYGTTSTGGATGWGTIYKVGTGGSGYQLLHSFGGVGDGKKPYEPVTLDGSGWLYAVTYQGGTANFGTLIRLQLGGPGYQVLHEFTGPAADGRDPAGPVTLGAGGQLLGFTSFGGPGFVGTLYTAAADGTSYGLLRSLNAFYDGAQPVGAPLVGADGAIYGVTNQGAAFNRGGLFRVEADGAPLFPMHSFVGAEGTAPVGILAEPGRIFGSMYAGGPQVAGWVVPNTLGGVQFLFTLETILTDDFETADFRRWTLPAP